MFDVTTMSSALQDVFAGVVTAAFVLALKLIFFGAAVQVAAFFLPRWLRPLAVLAVLTFVVAYPAQLARIGDAFLARAGLVPQVGFSVPVPAGTTAPASLAGLQGLQGQVQGILDSFTAFLTSQLGL